MKCRIIVLYFALLSLVSCSLDETPDVPEVKNPVQITLMYFAGIDLKSYFNSNIADAKSAVKAGALGDYGVLYYFLPTTTSDATLVELSCEDGICVEREVMVYDDIESITPEALTRVLNDVKFDVDYSVLSSEGDVELNFIWSSHGTGWVLKRDDSKSTVLRSSSDEDRRFLSVDEKLIPTRFVGLEDDVTEGSMDVDEMCQAVKDCDIRFGYILFDACLMSSVEVLYRMQDICDYVVASPIEVLAAGFPYDRIIPYLFENNGMSYDLAGACQAYYNYYASSYAAVAMCVTSELNALAEVFSNLTLEDLTSEQRSQLQAYDGLSSHVFFDLGEYVEMAAGADADLTAFNTQFDRAFPEECRFHTSQYISNIPQTRTSYGSVTNYTGVSTSQPSVNTTYNAYWSDEPWAIASAAK